MSNESHNWFVAPDSKSGDGSREKPFHDPWLALRCAGPGDTIHIAAGTYYGRFDRSSWVIDSPRLTILGGYSHDFSRRMPWQTPSVFAVFRGYESPREINLLIGRDNHSELVLDGLCFDASGQNTYGEKPSDGMLSHPEMEGAIASFNAEEVTIKNCVFANCANGGVELSGDGSRFENNLVVNIMGLGMLDLRGTSGSTKSVVVTNNTFCFAHDDSDPAGVGADHAIGIRVGRSVVIQENVFVSCGNAAITLYGDLDRVSIDRNLFYVTPHDIVNFRGLDAADITEKNLDELEDLGLKSSVGNVIQDPGITGFRPDWLDAYSCHMLGHYAKPPRETLNALRITAGLPSLALTDLEKQRGKGGLAPQLSAQDILSLRFMAKQGFHPVELTTEFAELPAKIPLSYRPIDWSLIDTPDLSLANQPVELRVGFGYEQNANLLSDADSDRYMGIWIYRPSSDDGSIQVLARRHALANRQFEEADKSNNGRDVEIFYLLRGVYRTDVNTSHQQVTLVVDSIVLAPLLSADAPPRPEGRDWFVKAGASGGDGTREKPFRDPFQALDKAESGDAIHVTGGDYFGKLHSGKWKIQVRNLTLLGGYDTEFTERDPWKNPTRFLLTEDERAKGIPDGTILGSENNSEGLILDGFVFDGASYNIYFAGGSLDPGHSPSSAMLDLMGTNASITVRNCIFLNACSAAVSISCPLSIFENNIVLNTSGWSLQIKGNGAGPCNIRSNTFLFAGDPTSRAGTGKTSSEGVLFLFNGRATANIDSNIFGFADNYGVRCTTAQSKIAFTNNVFAANLFNHLTDAGYLWADSSNWERRAVADSAFSSFKGNTLDLPKLPVDSKYADLALARLFTLPSRIPKDEWKNFAGQIGSSATPAEPVAPSASPAAEVAKPAASSTASLDDLLASIRSIDSQMKQVERKTETASEPSYCPVYDWKKALDLALESPVDGPGARRRKLTVSFAEVHARAEIQYTQITSQRIDADHASLENSPVELEITEIRACSHTPSVFPAGMTEDNYAAYYVTTVGGVSVTRVSAVVPLDTAAYKILNRTTPTDKVLLRGIARIPANPKTLSIVVDTVEPL